MAEGQGLFGAMARWRAENQERFQGDLQAVLREPTTDLSLESCSIALSSRYLAALAVVWENGSVEVIVASAINPDDPAVTTHQIADPSDLPPILDRLLQVVSDGGAN